MRKSAAIASVLLLSCMSASGQSADVYLDQRSTATELVQSYYNAINRREYARAWDYWGGYQTDKSYDEFAAGFADTETVRVLTGPESSEGAAGSLYYVVPVVIEATGVDGGVQTYSGCYTLRLAQPAIQEPPFQPLHIEAASLNLRKGTIETVGPESCD